MTIKNFSIEYDAINSKNTFTDGDTVNGRIIVETSKETKIQSLVFIAQAKASVGRNYPPTNIAYRYQHNVYWTKEKLYDVKQHLLREARQRDDMEVFDKGRNVFPFSFKIPDRKLPSFKDRIGKAVHKLKAELKQPMKPTKKAKSHFTCVSKEDMDFPRRMDPQHEFKDKSGAATVSMDFHIKRIEDKQGEALQLIVQATPSVKPKSIVFDKKLFIAQGPMSVSTNDIPKEKIESIESSGKEIVTKVIAIPSELPPSILNCSILKREYRVKIHLDLKFTSTRVTVHPPVTATTMAAAAAAFGEQDQVSWSTEPQPQPEPEAADPPPSYGAHAMYPLSN